MKKYFYTIARVVVLAFAITSLVLNVPLWVQFALNMLSPLVWGVTSALEESI